LDDLAALHFFFVLFGSELHSSLSSQIKIIVTQGVIDRCLQILTG